MQSLQGDNMAIQPKKKSLCKTAFRHPPQFKYWRGKCCAELWNLQQSCNTDNVQLSGAALLVAAIRGLQIALPVPKLVESACLPHIAPPMSTTATGCIWTSIHRSPLLLPPHPSPLCTHRQPRPDPPSEHSNSNLVTQPSPSCFAMLPVEQFLRRFKNEL